MAKERVFTYRNVGTSEKPVWEKWFQKTVADAVLMSDGEEETKTIVDYVNQKISELIGGAPEAYNTLKEIADYITSHKSVSDALNQAITNKAEKNHVHTEASVSAAGFMSASDKKKLDGLEGELGKKLNASLKGTANGLAELDSSGKVPAGQLPSYVDDVIDCWSSWDSVGNKTKLYSDSGKLSEISSGESGKIYATVDTNKIYRWSGSKFAEISPTIALGETSSTAYRGDRGKTAYEHSQADHARADATKTEKSETNGNVKINGQQVVVYTHPSHTEKTADLYKVTVDRQGHVTNAEKVQKSDITKLGIPGQDTTYSNATQSAPGLMSAEDKKKMDTMPQIYFQSDLPSSAPAGSICFLI